MRDGGCVFGERQKSILTHNSKNTQDAAHHQVASDRLQKQGHGMDNRIATGA
jgi:hypothetical protein